MESKPEFDNAGQLKRIEAQLIPGETLYAVYDCKGGSTGFVGITDRRLSFYDQAFLRKKKAMVSVPHSKIAALASEDTGGVLLGSSRLIISTTGAQEYEFSFRSNEKAHRAYTLIMTQMLQSEISG